METLDSRHSYRYDAAKMKRPTICTVLLIVSCFAVASCATGRKQDETITSEEEMDEILSRPRFEKPVTRPLGRVLISWTAVMNADGYEIQSSNTEDFQNTGKSWTVSGTELELVLKQDEILFVRIRSFAGNTVSRWSNVLEIREGKL